MKSLKKILAVFMAIMLAFSLAACSEEEEEVAPAGTTPIGKDKLKIGVLYTSTPEINEIEIEEDKDAKEEAEEDVKLDSNFVHRNGIDVMQGYLGILDEQIFEVNGLSAKDTDKFNDEVKGLVKQGCQIIFATSYDYLPLIEKAAEKEAYKGIVFVNYLGNSSEASTGKAPAKLKNTNNNVMTFAADIHEASYLSGIAAGMKAKEEKNATIGYVAPTDSKNAEVTAAVNAFALGAQSVYADAKVKVSVTNDWTDKAAIDASVKALEKAKCGVISKFIESDDAFCAPVWHLENAYISIITMVSRGEWTPENYFGGITEGTVDVSVNEEEAAKGTKEAIKAAKEDLMKDDFILFDKGLEKADKTKLDSAIANENIQTMMNFYVKGVTLLK